MKIQLTTCLPENQYTHIYLYLYLYLAFVSAFVLPSNRNEYYGFLNVSHSCIELSTSFIATIRLKKVHVELWLSFECESAPFKAENKTQISIHSWILRKIYFVWFGFSTSCWNSVLNSHRNPNTVDWTIIFHDNKNQHQMQKHSM